MKIVETGKRKTQINLTALIDILFLLIIFLTVTTRFINQQGVSVNLPSAKGGAGVTVTEKLLVEMDEKERLYLNGIRFEWKQLDKEIQNSKYDRNKKVVLNIDQKVVHGKVIALLDVLKQNRFQKVVFGTENKN